MNALQWLRETGALLSVPVLIILIMIFGETKFLLRWAEWVGNVIWDDN